eukprot:EG_transcript_13436
MKDVKSLNGDVGGGQIVRNAFCYAALMQQPIHVYNIRGTRNPPGLRPQHLTGVRVINEMTTGQLVGDEVGTMEVTFLPKQFTGGNFTADTGTAGSVTLLIQITLPCMLFSPQHSTLVLKGGTDLPLSPPLDEMRYVFSPVVRQWFGVEFVINLRRRGFYPRGRGEVQVVVHRPLASPLQGICLLDRGVVCAFYIYVFAVGDREARDLDDMASACLEVLQTQYSEVDDFQVTKQVDSPSLVLDIAASITVVAETTTGCRFGATSFRDKKRWSPGVRMGQEAADKLLAELRGGGCVDQFVQDQLVIFMSLAKGLSRLRVATITEHTESAMTLARMMTDVRWEVQRDHDTFIISCDGIGLDPLAVHAGGAASPASEDPKAYPESPRPTPNQEPAEAPMPSRPPTIDDAQHDIKPQRERRVRR